MLFIFVKTDILLKNKRSLFSVNRACSLIPTFTLCRWTSTTKSSCLHQQRLWLLLRRVQSTLVPLAPEGDQQFSAGCLASVLTQ